MTLPNNSARNVIFFLVLQCTVLRFPSDTSTKVQAFVISVKNPIKPTTATVHRPQVSLLASAETVAGTSENKFNLDWSFLDGVFLITCPNGDPDGSRMNSTRETLSQVSLLDNLKIKEFNTDDENRIRGCYSSHLSVYRDILKETYNAKKLWNGLDFFSGFKQNPEVCADVNVLILEDNVALCSRSVMQEALDSIASFVSKPDFEWDVIHLCKVRFLVCRFDEC
jgi:hypothetical protein